jgi:hypothetical protein
MFLLLPQGKQSILVSDQHITAIWEDEPTRRTIILTDCGKELWTDSSLREILELGGMKCRMAVNYEDAESADDEPQRLAIFQQYRAGKRYR